MPLVLQNLSPFLARTVQSSVPQQVIHKGILLKAVRMNDSVMDCSAPAASAAGCW